MRILVTGSSGFIGKNLCAHLAMDSSLEISHFDRRTPDSELVDKASKAEFVFHLAGVNRPSDPAEFVEGNERLTERLLTAVGQRSDVGIVLASSTQAALDNPYGRSKLAAESAVTDWVRTSGGNAYTFRLPGVFGKWCRPDYNSVVATFCHNVANGKTIKVDDPAKQLELAYVDDVIRAFVAALHGHAETDGHGFCQVGRTFSISLEALAALVQSFRDIPSTLTVPDFGDDLTRAVYATYTSYLPAASFGYDLEMKRDQRGWLTEVIKSRQFGQIFVSRTAPGVTRGNHWHHTKIEKFIVVQGEAEIRFRNLHSEEVVSYRVTGDQLQVFDMPAGHVHSITNIGDGDLLTLFWSDEIFDPGHPDTYPAEV